MAIALLFTASCRDGGRAVTQFPVLGQDPVPGVAQMEEQREALALWARAGALRRATVIHVASQPDLAGISDEDVERIQSLLRTREGDIPADHKEGSPLTSRNYLAAAAKLGIIRTVYWIIPSRQLEYSDGEWMIKRLLATSQSPPAAREIDGMRLRDGCVAGRMNGAEVLICSPETLPPVSEPVILDIDAGFFPRYAAERDISNLGGLKDFFDKLSARKLRVASASVSFSGGGLSSRSVRRYLGEQAAEMLGSPEVMKANAANELWSLRDGAEMLFAQDRMRELVSFLKEPLKKYPEEPSLVMFHAVASALSGEEERPLATLGHLCRKDARTCWALLYAGAELRSRSRSGSARNYFHKAREIWPGWPDAAAEYRDLLTAGTGSLPRE